VLTNYQISEYLDDILFALLVSPEEVIACASTKHLAASLVCSPQLLVGRSILESVLLSEFVAPKGTVISVDSIVGAPTDQTERNDVFVSLEAMSDSLVELHYVSVFAFRNVSQAAYLDR